ncbi:RNB domain-containing ribonuclease [Sphingomonas oryzagri]|uniref:RNB domain-containing ribonuclease n=1 Tax=Sphingomonas oryzagri TaxID=3042314 RepID=A0ABT6MZ95_9SPHN|nr:RNB domain-containing ribonuclease [Sphingomonas oryzagri]MDH7638384.1 RNB domain-containing ribonuclease [Sphingomonas oryzagri]
MKTLIDPDHALADGLATLRTEYQVPTDFPPAVVSAASDAAQKPLTEHVDRRAVPFVTLDPASSTDLDQALAIEAAGNDLLLHYAIADVAWFVDDGSELDQEAWRRGETLYLPDGKASLYPKLLSEGAASLLANVDRPAVIFTVRVAPDGTALLDGAERAVIRSTAKLAYETVRPEDLPQGFGELARRISAAEDARGAARVDPPEQEVAPDANGTLRLTFRPRLAAEDQNAALSLATNLAVAKLLLQHRTGLFRVMAPPDAASTQRLRHSAAAFGLDWPQDETLDQFSRTLDAGAPKQAAFMLAIRRAGSGASYAPYRDGVTPWHAAMAATYAQATAPLRRLADRYVVRAALAVANGQPVPSAVLDAFEKLPAVMAKADARAGQIERAVIDLAEAALLNGRESETFPARVIDADDRGGRVQLCDLPVVARVDGAGLEPGASVTLRLTSADLGKRSVRFAQA